MSHEEREVLRGFVKTLSPAQKDIIRAEIRVKIERLLDADVMVAKA